MTWATRARSLAWRLMFVWNLGNGVRVVFGITGIAVSGGVSVRSTPLIGVPLGLAVLAAGAFVAPRLDSLLVRWLLRPVSGDLIRLDGSLVDVTKSVCRSIHGSSVNAYYFSLPRRFLCAFIIIAYLSAHIVVFVHWTG